jgi:ABC-2 type transport system permease protein
MDMTANPEFEQAVEWAALRGFNNLFHKENLGWWAARRGWLNALFWTGLLEGLVVLMVFVVPEIAATAGDPTVAASGGTRAFGLEMGYSVFFDLGALVLALGVIVLCQDLVVDEKQSGLTEWLLSKPVVRRAYVLAKFSAAVLGVGVLLLALPALAVYLTLSVRAAGFVPVLPFLAGAGILAVHTLFYLSLTLLLGVLFSSRRLILGVAMGILLGGSMLAGLVQVLALVTPWTLSKLAPLAAQGQALSASLLWPPLLASLAWSVIFLWAAVAAFEKLEL